MIAAYLLSSDNYNQVRQHYFSEVLTKSLRTNRLSPESRWEGLGGWERGEGGEQGGRGVGKKL